MGQCLERMPQAHPEPQELEMERPRYLNSPQPRRRIRIPSARAQKVRSLLKLVAVVALSPVLLPLGILILPFFLWRSHREKKREAALEALRNRNPKVNDLPPVPTPDPELNRRRELARHRNKSGEARSGILYDPISDDPAYAWAVKEAGMRASEEVGKPYEMGHCHLVWMRMKEILSEEFDITWYSPREMNPRVRFD
jgi:hypothetical protein